MRLHDLLDRVASADEPVSRLDAAQLYAGGVRRRRRVRLVRGAGAVGATALALVVLVISTIAGGPKRQSEDPVTPDRSNGPGGNPFVVDRVGGYDRNHLWIWGEVAPGRGHVTASTDNGGRTWTRHTEPQLPPSQTTAENYGLLSAVDGRSGVSAYPGGRDHTTVVYTTDKWRTRASATVSATPVRSASGDGLVFCQWNYGAREQGCRLGVFEPADKRYAPLANVPAAMRPGSAARAPDGTIWVSGVDPANQQPVMASSADGGGTWDRQVLTDLPPVTVQEFSTLGGNFSFAKNGAVLFTALDPTATMDNVLRFADGRWQRLADISPRSEVATWLTDDGTHVRQEVQASPPAPGPTPSRDANGMPTEFFSPGPSIYKVTGVRLCRPGSTGYVGGAPLKGIPVDQAMVGLVENLPGGGYLGWNFGGIWFSPNGLTWQEIPRPTS